MPCERVCVIACCGVLQHVVACCSVLQRVVTVDVFYRPRPRPSSVCRKRPVMI